MNFPFTTEQFLDVFRAYNLAVWPAQIFLVVLVLIPIFFLEILEVDICRFVKKYNPCQFIVIVDKYFIFVLKELS